MRDPFIALKNALQRVFHLEAMRNGKYTYSEIQQLKESLDHFQLNKKNFKELLNALSSALPFIEKWRIDFKSIKNPLDQLAKELQLPLINWDTYLSRSNASSTFQFSALHHKHQETELLPWLAEMEQDNNETHEILLQKLLKYKEYLGFSQKLSAHLENEPDFLFQLIKESETNFIQIAQTRLVLYLTDQQLAEAIIQHSGRFVQNHPNPINQATQLVDTLNEILSNGRSISTLLHNAEAKSLLDNFTTLDGFKLFQIYQQQDPTTSTSPPASLEEEGFKPSM